MTNSESLRGQGIDPSNFDRGTFTQFQTWLGETRGVEGCPVNCTYCFFKLDGMTPARPRQLTTPEDVIAKLRLSPTYQENIPVHFGSQTDVFSTKANIEYYTKLLTLYGDSDYKNPLIFITKRLIPDSFVELSKQVPQSVIFYVSYSGLAGTGLEPTVVEDHQRENFVKLHANDVPAVHYWRPFTPLNSSDMRLRSILDHVSRYASCSVVNGLRLNSGIREHVGQIWPELFKYDFDFSTLGEVWPEGVRQRLSELVTSEYHKYPVFFGNTPCSVSRALHEPDRAGIYNGKMCLESNCDQRGLCKDNYKMPTHEEILDACDDMGIDEKEVIFREDMVEMLGNIDAQAIVYLRNKLRFPVIPNRVDYAGGHNWAHVNESVKITEVEWGSNEEIR